MAFYLGRSEGKTDKVNNPVKTKDRFKLIRGIKKNGNLKKGGKFLQRLQKRQFNQRAGWVPSDNVTDSEIRDVDSKTKRGTERDWKAGLAPGEKWTKKAVNYILSSANGWKNDENGAPLEKLAQGSQTYAITGRNPRGLRTEAFMRRMKDMAQYGAHTYEVIKKKGKNVLSIKPALQFDPNTARLFGKENKNFKIPENENAALEHPELRNDHKIKFKNHSNFTRTLTLPSFMTESDLKKFAKQTKKDYSNRLAILSGAEEAYDDKPHGRGTVSEENVKSFAGKLGARVLKFVRNGRGKAYNVLTPLQHRLNKHISMDMLENPADAFNPNAKVHEYTLQDYDRENGRAYANGNKFISSRQAKNYLKNIVADDSGIYGASNDKNAVSQVALKRALRPELRAFEDKIKNAKTAKEKEKFTKERDAFIKKRENLIRKELTKAKRKGLELPDYAKTFDFGGQELNSGVSILAPFATAAARLGIGFKNRKDANNQALIEYLKAAAKGNVVDDKYSGYTGSAKEMARAKQRQRFSRYAGDQTGAGLGRDARRQLRYGALVDRQELAKSRAGKGIRVIKEWEKKNGRPISPDELTKLSAINAYNGADIKQGYALLRGTELTKEFIKKHGPEPIEDAKKRKAYQKEFAKFQKQHPEANFSHTVPVSNGATRTLAGKGARQMLESVEKANSIRVDLQSLLKTLGKSHKLVNDRIVPPLTKEEQKNLSKKRGSEKTMKRYLSERDRVANAKKAKTKATPFDWNEVLPVSMMDVESKVATGEDMLVRRAMNAIGHKEVRPGDHNVAKYNRLMGHDGTRQTTDGKEYIVYTPSGKEASEKVKNEVLHLMDTKHTLPIKYKDYHVRLEPIVRSRARTKSTLEEVA